MNQQESRGPNREGFAKKVSVSCVGYGEGEQEPMTLLIIGRWTDETQINRICSESEVRRTYRFDAL